MGTKMNPLKNLELGYYRFPSRVNWELILVGVCAGMLIALVWRG